MNKLLSNLDNASKLINISGKIMISCIFSVSTLIAILYRLREFLSVIIIIKYEIIYFINLYKVIHSLFCLF